MPRPIIALLALTIACGWLGPIPAAQAQPMLFTEPDRQHAFQPDADPTVVRSRPIRVDFDRVSQLQLGGGDAIVFNLFDDVSLVGIFERIELRSPTDFAWLGSIVGQPDGSFVLVVANKVMVANIRAPGVGSFQLRFGGDGLHVVREIDQSRFAPCATGPQDAVAPPAPYPPQPRSGLRTDDGSSFDVLVVYTAAARAAAGGTTAMNALVDLAVYETNAAYTDSLVNPQINLVYSGEIAYTETGNSSTDLTRLRNTSDGYMDDVHTLRNDFGADLVCLIVQSMDACGRAYLMTSLSTGFASSAFSVVKRSCATGYYSFGHELGHNIGCAHDRDNAGAALFSYSYGYREPGSAWRTIMAYAPGTRVRRFSNPDVLYAGQPTGVPIEQPDSAHNALSINNAAFTVANFRAHVYDDCNSNSIPDAEDITAGTSSDDNGDGVPDECQRLYVDAGAGGAGDGTSWTDAFTDLQDALASAAAKPPGVVLEIWLAAATYKPAGPGGPRNATFDIPAGVTVYGGFAGAETTLGERDPANNLTVLSGDLNGNDGPGLVNNGENSYHVVWFSPSDPPLAATIDGCTIAGGNADGVWPDAAGGGVFNDGGWMVLQDCLVLSNAASLLGGGIFQWNSGTMTLVNCLFTGNTADSGAALYTDSISATVVDSTFAGNTAGNQFGGLYRGAGTLAVANCVLWGNSDSGGSGESAQIELGAAVDAVNYTCIQGLTGSLGGTGNIGADPLLADADGPDGVYGTTDDDARLLPGSPCIDAGDNTAVPAGVTMDLDGNPRLIDDPATIDTGNPPGGAPFVDMGAYEAPASPVEAIVSAASLLDHGGTELALDLTANNIEPRTGGVLKIEFQLTGPAASASASVSCLNSGYGGQVTTTPAGTTLTVEFLPALPDQDCCEITLTGAAAGVFAVRTLQGDVDRNGIVATTDAGIIKPHFGESADAANAVFDQDTNGTIATTDFGLVKPLFGNTAPACP